MIRYFAREKNCQYIAFGMGSGNTQMELTWIGKGSQTVPPPPSRNRAIPARTHHAEPLPLDASPPWTPPVRPSAAPTIEILVRSYWLYASFLACVALAPSDPAPL